MAWQQFSVVTNESTAPLLADFFSDHGAVSVTYLDAEDQPVYEPAIGETVIWHHTQVVALFESDCNPEWIKFVVYEHFKDNLLQNWLHEQVEDQVWERAWMAFYQPMKFANKLWVCPTGQEQHEPGCVCMTLDPGLAFGTGTHPTTALCLEWLASTELTGKTVIDYGCGSGILAVAALLLGAKEAHAVDIDPQALTATYDNALKNKVEDRIHCYLVAHFTPLKADTVIANILAKPLIDLSATVCDLVAENGNLVLSGILSDQTEAVIAAYLPYVGFTNVTQHEDWVRLDGKKHP